MTRANASEHWQLIHAERTRVSEMLEGLQPEQWQSKTLCDAWTAEQMTAHLAAGASLGTLAWIWSMIRAGFNTDKHNNRAIARFRGRDPEQTLEIYRRAVNSTVVPAGAYTALLAEAIVHGQDIAQPLGLELRPEPRAVRRVARLFASKDFTVNSSTLIKGLALEADDAEFQVGEGPLVCGELLDLVMAMAGRRGFCERLRGDGVAELRRRIG